MDPLIYIQALGALVDIVEKIPKGGLSDEERLELANKTDVAKKLLAATTDEEKAAAMAALGKLTDENPS